MEYLYIYLSIGLIWGCWEIYAGIDKIMYASQIWLTIALFVILWPVLLWVAVTDKIKEWRG